MSFSQHIQASDLGAKVTLWHIDLSMFNEPDLFLTSGPNGTSAVSFGGQVYSPHPIQGEGFETRIGGTQPQPVLTLSNIGGLLTTLVEQNDDLQGAVVRRIRTYDRFLDGGAEPDGNAHKPIDVFEISRKTKDTETEIAFQLKAYMDQQGSQLPARVITKGYCSHTYRRWNGSAFEYTDVSCPYTGASSFDTNDDATTDANDSCSKRLSGCQARFGVNGSLPTRAFPGVSRLRVR